MRVSTPGKHKKQQIDQSLKSALTLSDLYTSNDPYAALNNGKSMAKAWAKSLTEKDHIAQVQTFIFKIIESYWQKSHEQDGLTRSLPFLLNKIVLQKLDKSVLAVAEAIGAAAAKLPVIDAGYHLGNVYTAVLPEATRSGGGIFYTPPALTGRLIQMAENAGVDWRKAKIIDPACGGGAFLAPLCLKIAAVLSDREPNEILEHIQSHVTGWEIDPFGGWLSQVFVEVALKDLIRQAGVKMQPLVKVCDSLGVKEASAWNSFDLVIGNPPYGKVKLSDSIRRDFKDSLYGHPNYYGLFTHLAIRLAAGKGVIAYLTPTSFLSGEYFKNLRAMLRRETTPQEIDFVSFRKGVFEDVLQETMLAVYCKQPSIKVTIKVNQISPEPGNRLQISNVKTFPLSADIWTPWILPRTPLQARIVQAMQNMPHKLTNWGYRVSTGPLVWNRHKKQLSQKENKNTYPIIWAEAVTQDGNFILKSEKRNHSPYLKFQDGDEWLVTDKPCILLQRTTAKEQNKRLIAAAIPEELIRQKRGVVVENHLNMIIATVDRPRVPASVLAVFLNSQAVNEAFRTISGSVAVSAYELESLPLPDPTELADLQQLIENGGDSLSIDTACQRIYNLNN